ncbi:hypothetical protein GCM10009809_16390 [Isoptericola hypogeus]|uniref:PepSY domain-containing protein n=1 Tax=Isoptericola hypogeus TaxID=300179 RepID=A0ABP4VEF2_9MICO
MNLRSARRATVPAALAVSLGLVLTACGDGSGDDTPPAGDATTAAPTDDAEPDDTSADGTTSDDDAAPDATTSPERRTAAGLRAIVTAEKEAGGTAFAIDDPDRDNTWEVDVSTGKLSVEVEVSADGGEVVRTENDDLDADDRRAIADARYTIGQAIERTVAKAGGALEDAELDGDDGRYHWSVTVLVDGAEVDYRVGTQTGKVTPEPADDDD